MERNEEPGQPPAGGPPTEPAPATEPAEPVTAEEPTEPVDSGPVSPGPATEPVAPGPPTTPLPPTGGYGIGDTPNWTPPPAPTPPEGGQVPYWTPPAAPPPEGSQVPYWTPPAAPPPGQGQPPPWGPPTGPPQGGPGPYWGQPQPGWYPPGPYAPPQPSPPGPPGPRKGFLHQIPTWARGLIAAALAIIIVFVVADAMGVFTTGAAKVPPGTDASLHTAATTPPGGTAPSLDIRSVLRAVEPGVVDINTSATGNFGGATEGEGTGMIIDSQGNVLTNAHVVNGSTTVSIQIFGQATVYQAKVLGTDAADDIALIQIQNPGQLNPVSLGSSSGLQVGDPVVAIGNALGLAPGGPSVTSGIISALNRSLNTGTERLSGLIQTDAPINPGNSGGPLVDASGKVVGMNTAISNDGQNIGFAIPIDKITPLIDGLKKGSVTPAARGFLGVQISAAPSGGAQITAVTPGTPAASAGLQVNDIIVAVDNQAVATSADAADLIGSHPPGSKVTIKYQRGSTTQTITVTLAPPPASATG